MKVIKLLCAFLLPLAVLSCSDGNGIEEENSINETAQTNDATSAVSNELAEKVIPYLQGKWNLVRQGEIDFLPSGVFIEIGADKKVTCEYGVGLDNYHKTDTETIQFEDDWTFEEKRIIGHLNFLFCGENRFLCTILGDDFGELVLLPDEGSVYIMDPTKYLKRVSVK